MSEAAAVVPPQALQQQKRMLQQRLNVIKRASATRQEAFAAVALNDALVSLQFQLDEIMYQISAKENSSRTNVINAFEKELERASRRKFFKAPRRRNKQQTYVARTGRNQHSQKQKVQNVTSTTPSENSPAEHLLKHWEIIFQQLKPLSKNRKIKHATWTLGMYSELNLEIPKHTGEIPALISALEALASK